MTASEKDRELRARIARIAPRATLDDARTLRRAALTLSRWSELECGDGNDFASWAIERDETTGKPYRCVYPHKGDMRRYPIPDRERGALARVKSICERLGLHFYHQTDPRGAPIYLSDTPIRDEDYTNGISVS